MQVIFVVMPFRLSAEYILHYSFNALGEKNLRDTV